MSESPQPKVERILRSTHPKSCRVLHPAPRCVADFCLIPMGTEASVTKYIAEVQKVLEKSGLIYELHGYGTNLEGEWSEVMKAIEDSHKAVHAMGCARVATDIRVGTRTDKESSNFHKRESVKQYLAKPGQ